MAQSRPNKQPPVDQPPHAARTYQTPKLTPLGHWQTFTLINSICQIGCTNLFKPSHTE